ncbi:nuclear transport factor 2 family protein [Aliidiomarina taiwanensis]|uniref:Nuclear transport factor 2 family protein n=1 Tax=Aliidiomarina taiwanensis TaxID=946228 RepID=A0A432X1B4_9GAMM|nr:nuclear transport factor 2 family protein [Aliidiomarina taiwanensis]RUO39893.1 nuclear transport factor 2 family protein [Aliidiomarina taiwanensis]
MRKLTLLMLFFISFNTFAHTDVEAELTGTIETFLYGASINDPQAHAAFWADGLTYTSSSGKRFGKETLMQGFEGVQPEDPAQTDTWYGAEDIEVKVLNKVVIVNFTLTAATDGIVIGRYFNTGVFVHRDGRWQAINWNATIAAD